MVRLLFLGDIVGKPGRRVVKECLPALIEELRLDLVVANGENAAGGFRPHFRGGGGTLRRRHRCHNHG